MLHDVHLRNAEASGVWWRPEAPDDRLPGILRTHESEEADLSLTGEWRSPDGSRVRESRIICGLTDRLGWVVLDGCGQLLPGEVFAGSQHRTVGFRRTHCTAHTVLAGDDLGPDCKLEFGRVSVEFSHLTEWAYMQGVSEPFHREMVPYDEYRDGFTVTVPRLAELTAKVADVTVVIRPWVATRTTPPLGLKVEPKLYVDLERPITEGLDRWHDTVNDMREFFSFLIGVPIRSRHTWASVHHSGDVPPTTVEVHEPRSQASPFWANVRRHDMLVEYREFAGSFKTHVELWLQRTPDLVRACRQFLVARDGTKYEEQRFLSLARALEVLHIARDCRGKRGRPAFQQRVQDLLGSVREQLSLSATGIPALAIEIEYWRHGFTHLLEGREIANSTTSERVFRLGQLIEITFEACMLQLLGFSSTDIHTVIQRKLEQRLPFIRELISEAGKGDPAA